MRVGEDPDRRTMRRWYETKLAERAAMLCHQATERRLLNRLALKAQNGTIGKADPAVDRFMESDDMQVRIGDDVHNHYPQESQAPASQPMSGLKKAALAAALLGAGGGIGAAVPWLTGAPNSTPPAVEFPADHDTQYELHLGGGR